MAKITMVNYQLDKKSRFVIEDYQNSKPFASFLPGIAGLMGIPLWVFYVNRGQAISSFGVENKDNPILEYQTANRAYQLTSYLGFRTFIRKAHGNSKILYEPFLPGPSKQKMVIGANELILQEINKGVGLKIKVVYFLLPGESFSGLVRMVKLTNISDKVADLEILDGLPAVTPFGVNNQILKDIGRTIEAWMEVYHLEQKIPYYHLRASVADTTEVSSFEAGHYILAFGGVNGGAELLPFIVDPVLVFGKNTALSVPVAFYRQGLDGLLSQKQITCGRTPCGFATMRAKVKPGKSTNVISLFGHVNCFEDIHSQVERLTNLEYFDKRRQEANELVHNLMEVISCHTGSTVFDAYCGQTFIDNILRGGWPIVCGAGKERKVYHVYSRKHGDLERDYNAFSVAPEFYSQGNGSYRDVNQNRREDVWFCPEMGDFNIRVFMSLIQADGYNPLVIQGGQFTILPEKLKGLLGLSHAPTKLRELFSRPFSPGSLLKEIVDRSIGLKVEIPTFLQKVFENSEQHINASMGEGYWVDHWTYNLDLIDSYLAIFPDEKHDLLFSTRYLPFYDSSLVVKPRSRKYILFNGKPRQKNSVTTDRQKAAMIKVRKEGACWMRINHGRGAIYCTTLFAKLFILMVIKFSTLDPGAMGIEMEADRPGWDDALNGLPGLFGSSMCETYALERLVSFLHNTLESEGTGRLNMPVEVIQLLRRVVRESKRLQSSDADERFYQYWDKVSSAREVYRARVRLGIDGEEGELTFADLKKVLELFDLILKTGINRALELNNGLPPSYFIYKVEEYELLNEKNSVPKNDLEEYPTIRVKRFSPQPLPLFLEGMVRAMRLMDTSSAQELYDNVKESSLFDRKLRMYRINAPLENLPKDIGRARAFTPGWLENESIWLHMEYKYLLEVLRAGLYKDFFEDFKSALIPFLDPNVYARSLLENSSFLVSSAHLDESLHGTGFVARLSGASAEFLSMWRMMMAGVTPFFLKDGLLCLALEPILPTWLFSDDHTVSFRFLGQTMVIYHNPNRIDTFDQMNITSSTTLHYSGGDVLELNGSLIPAPYAQQVRDGMVEKIDVYFS